MKPAEQLIADQLNRPGHFDVIIVGAGFGGLAAAKQLAKSGLKIAVFDRNNHHLFQPLLYQVATADLSPAEIAWPVRNILARYRNISVMMTEVISVDFEHCEIVTTSSRYQYGDLILATGAATSYFGHDEWSQNALGLKSLDDATGLRAQILTAFEKAEICTDPQERARLLNFVVVGGGPTGVEMAGAIAELAGSALARDFRQIGPGEANVFLVDGADRILGALSPDLSDYAQDALEDLGVEVILNQHVQEISSTEVVTDAGRIQTRTVIWAAGVSACKMMGMSDVDCDRSGRVEVLEDLSVPGRPNVFVIGDAAKVSWGTDREVPGIAPAAKQQGKYVGRLLSARFEGRPIPAFRYRHAGNLATIGRHRAVVDFGRYRLKGWTAWWFWGLIHIYFLIGARSATVVLLQWFWSYLTHKKGARLISSSGPAVR